MCAGILADAARAGCLGRAQGGKTELVCCAQTQELADDPQHKAYPVVDMQLIPQTLGFSVYGVDGYTQFFGDGCFLFVVKYGFGDLQLTVCEGQTFLK